MKTQAYNPFLPLNVYIPDGEPHVFGDRVYLFGSHDREAGDTFCSEPYEVWSAPVDDLSDWSCPGVSFDPKQDPLYDPETRNAAYAPDAVHGNDGRYYLYYCLAGYRGKGGYSNPIGVAVCDTPDGRYEYLGVVKNPDGTPFLKYANFDPAVMNDDGVIRLYSGTWYREAEFRNGTNDAEIDAWEAERFGKTVEHIQKLNAEGDAVYGPHHMTLAEDMMTITSEPVRVLPLHRTGTPYELAEDGKGYGFFEGSSIRKINGRYYFTYSSMNNHELCYAVSDYPDRDFVFGGTIVSNGDIGYQGRKKEDRLNTTGTTHGSIECVNGQWYVFYHRLTHKSDYSRQACAEKITIEPDGSIHQVEITSCGLNGGPLNGTGVYPALICCNLTNGHMPHSSNKKQDIPIPYIGSEDGERMIKDIRDHTMIAYKYFAFEGTTEVILTVRGEGEGAFEVCTDPNGPVLGSAAVPPSSGWQELSIPVSSLTGVKPLYLFYSGSGRADLLRIELCR
jgi:hypothetical protein